MADRPKKAPRDEHLGGPRSVVRAVLWLLVPPTLVGLALKLAGSGVGDILLTACLFAWAVFALAVLLQRLVIESAGDAVGHLLMPSGASTPGGKPLSRIEAMEARGELQQAAEAYRAEIARDPRDVTSCERLALLALRRLHDHELALWAYREAERRADARARKYGLGLLAAAVCRDYLKDRSRTVRELRRLVQQYPDAPRVDALRKEIDDLKAAMWEEESGA